MKLDLRELEHPAFSVLESAVRERLAALGHFPEPSELRELALGIPTSVKPWFDFVPQDDARLAAAGGFDALIAESGLIPTRPGLHHDLLGALIWLHFPALKTAIHRAQMAGSVGPRGPSKNAATHLDESGVLVVSSDSSVFEALADLKWLEVFWQRRAALEQTTRFIAFGHGLLDSLREPHPKLMGKALFVRVAKARLELSAAQLRVFLDRNVAQRLASFLVEPARLQPLPVLGVPGWAAQQCEAFYGRAQYFRVARARPRAASVAAWLELGSDA
ncbi:MAG TPA: DUF3025 domain-containing protein [Polyangiaceae bacterium]|jgi:hypothetical protein|nr:DUF3025 domain-containing protein [Polyangiaceae bacterium]